MTIARRDLLRSGWKLGSALLAAAAGWTVFESLRPLANAAAKPKIKLGGTAKFAEGTSTYVPQGRLYVTNAGGQLFALSQKCTHLGCRVPFCESSGRFECGCHGSVFDLGGEWIKGPAPRGMDRFALTLEGDVLQVDTGQVSEGPPHGAEQFLTPPIGPSCIEEG
jgi:Rieske Fe-S protein